MLLCLQESCGAAIRYRVLDYRNGKGNSCLHLISLSQNNSEIRFFYIVQVRFQHIWLTTSHKFQKFLLEKGGYFAIAISGVHSFPSVSYILYMIMHKNSRHIHVSEVALFQLLEISLWKQDPGLIEMVLFWYDEHAAATNPAEINNKLAKEEFLPMACELKKPFFIFSLFPTL